MLIFNGLQKINALSTHSWIFKHLCILRQNQPVNRLGPI